MTVEKLIKKTLLLSGSKACSEGDMKMIRFQLSLQKVQLPLELSKMQTTLYGF